MLSLLNYGNSIALRFHVYERKKILALQSCTQPSEEKKLNNVCVKKKLDKSKLPSCIVEEPNNNRIYKALAIKINYFRFRVA